MTDEDTSKLIFLCTVSKVFVHVRVFHAQGDVKCLDEHLVDNLGLPAKQLELIANRVIHGMLRCNVTHGVFVC